ncbi:MAG: MoaD/ThiS family protein [Acidimicrobiia bacterium]
MTIRVRIPTQLRVLTDGAAEVSAAGTTVADLIVNLEGSHPGLAPRILDETGQVRRFVNIYVDEEDIRFLQGIDTQLAEGTEVSIIPAVAGG